MGMNSEYSSSDMYPNLSCATCASHKVCDETFRQINLFFRYYLLIRTKKFHVRSKGMITFYLRSNN